MAPPSGLHCAPWPPTSAARSPPWTRSFGPSPGRRAAATFGRPLVKRTLAEVLAAARSGAANGAPPPSDDEILARAVGARVACGHRAHTRHQRVRGRAPHRPRPRAAARLRGERRRPGGRPLVLGPRGRSGHRRSRPTQHARRDAAHRAHGGGGRPGREQLRRGLAARADRDREAQGGGGVAGRAHRDRRASSASPTSWRPPARSSSRWARRTARGSATSAAT